MTSRTASWYHDRALSCCLLAAVLLWASACAARTEKREEARRERPASSSSAARCVIHISVDGLRADAVARLGAARLPNFYRLRTEGTFTDNARTDYDYTVTLPDHACELTSRPVLGPDGHGLTFNYDDGRTLAQIHGSYVAGAFDVTHDNGCATGMYASKSKFDLFERSWNADNGAPDTIGPDNGRDKIDVYVNDANTTSLVATYIADMVSGLMQYSFIHVTDLDDVGHDFGWDSQPYFEALIHVDGLMGRVFDLVDSDAFLTGNTWIIVVADHGGDGTSHSDATDPLNYTVPFYAWGPGVPAGADLYRLNPDSRGDPGGGRPDYSVVPQPIRNGEVANLSLDLLGLGSVPGSSIDAAHDLNVMPPGGAEDLPSVSITSPPAGASYEYPSSVAIVASALAGTATIDRVEFFANYVRLGDDSTSPYEYVWNEVPLGDYRLTARAVADDGFASTASVEIKITSTAAVPAGHSSLGPRLRVFPNPTGRLSTVSFSLSKKDEVEVAVYDVLGRCMARLYRGFLGEGGHALGLDAAGFEPGLYFIALRSAGGFHAEKLMIVR